MTSEMSYRDKMIILIMSIVIILAIGIFALIRPRYDALVADRNTYNDTLAEWEGIEAKINQIPTLQDNIKKEYTEAKKLAEVFVNEMFEDSLDNENVSLAIDLHMQQFFDDTEFEVRNITAEGVKAVEMAYNYYTPNVLTYSLLENADINGNYAKEASDILSEATYLQSREVAQMLENKVEFEIRGKKESLLNFLTKMKEEEKNAVRITALEIADYSFGANEMTTVSEQQTDADGNVTTVTREVPAAADGEGRSIMKMTVSFFNAMPIDEPELGD